MSLFSLFSRPTRFGAQTIFTSPFPTPSLAFLRPATKRGGGSTKNTRGSAGRRLGPKVAGSAYVQAGQILIRQRGLATHPGSGTYAGKDHTIHAKWPGWVKWYSDPEGASVGYQAVTKRAGRRRKFIGVVRSLDEQLPRNEDDLGRTRYFPLVDLNTLPPPEPKIHIPHSTLLAPPSHDNEPLAPPPSSP